MLTFVESQFFMFQVKEDHTKMFTPTDKDTFDMLYPSTVSPNLAARYGRLHDALLKSKDGDHAPGDHRRRFEFVKGLKVPCKAVLYMHSGSGPYHLHFVWRLRIL